MKKLFILALALCLIGCGNNVEVAQPPIITIDGEVIYKYEVNKWLATHEYHLVAEVGRWNVGYTVEQYDVKVSEYVYNYYEIGDTIQFALKG